MSEWTDYHNINVPTPGGDINQWAAILNGAIDGTLEDVPRWGAFADRPANPPDGALYRATDREGSLYRYSGGSWSVQDGGSPGNGGGGGGGGTPIDFYLVGGQSNAVGRGNSSTSPTPPSDMALAVEDGTVSALDDPFGGGTGGDHQAQTGSAWPAFAAEYVDRTARKIAIASAATDSTAQTAAADDGFGNWSATGTHRSEAVSIATNSLSALRSAGYDPTIRGILWAQGEQDAGGITDGQITQGDYASAFADMVSYFRTELRDGLPIYVFQTGQPNDGDTPGYRAVREAQLQFPRDLSSVQVVSTVQRSFPSRGYMANRLHYNQDGYTLMGETGAANLVAGGGPIQGPVGSSELVVETGSVDLANPGNATDGSWDTSTATSVTVEFDTEFAAPPTVLFPGSTRPGGIVQRGAFSATSVDIYWRYYSSSGAASTTVQWVAIGETA